MRADKAYMRALFVELAAQAGVADPERVGTHLHLLYEGATVAVTAGGQEDALAAAREATARLLGG